MRPIVRNKCVKFRDPRISRSREIPPEAVGGCIWDDFVRRNLRLKVVGNVISGLAVQKFGVDVRVKCGDCRSNCSRDIRAAHFVKDERRRWTY